MAEAAGADHDGGGAGQQERQRALDRVVRREPGVGERRGVDRVEVVERHEVARARHEQQRRHAAVAAEAGADAPSSGGALAVVLHALRQRWQRPHPHGAVDRDRLPDLEAGDAGADGVDPAGVLVAERERRLNDISPGWKSWMRCRSEWQAPAPPMTTTSPGPGSGSGTSCTSGSRFQSIRRTACIGLSLSLTGPSWWAQVARCRRGPFARRCDWAVRSCDLRASGLEGHRCAVGPGGGLRGAPGSAAGVASSARARNRRATPSLGTPRGGRP